MARLAVVVALWLAAACGGSSKPAESKEPVPVPPPSAPPEPEPRALVYGDASLIGKPPPPKPEKPVGPPIYDRLRDDDGAVPGLTGFSTKRVRDPRRCGGFSILVKRAKKIAPSDAKIAAMFALEFPLDLDFSETKKAGSLLAFTAWMETLTKIAAAATTHYQGQFASADLGVKVAATARLSQLYFRAASVLARGEVSADVRTSEFADEATTAFCDALAEKAEPLVALGAQALEVCRNKAPLAPSGWWAELCKAP